jgi:hypothetical protein
MVKSALFGAAALALTVTAVEAQETHSAALAMAGCRAVASLSASEPQPFNIAVDAGYCMGRCQSLPSWERRWRDRSGPSRKKSAGTSA